MASDDGTSLGDGRVVKERDKAILVELESTGEEHWIPKSVIHADSEVWTDGQSGNIVVMAWFAEKEGLA